jgi:hypothetical protein
LTLRLKGEIVMGRRPALALPLLAVVALAVFPALAGATADQRDTSLFIPVIGNIVTAEDVDVDIGQPVDITRTFSSGVPYIALWMNMLGTHEGASLFVKVTHLDSQDALSDTWDFEMKGYESDVGWVFLEPGEGNLDSSTGGWRDGWYRIIVLYDYQEMYDLYFCVGL